MPNGKTHWWRWRTAGPKNTSGLGHGKYGGLMNKSRHATTDIEFLSGPTIKLRNQIIYSYQNSSGVLRHQVRRRVEEFAKTKGCMTFGPREGKLQNALAWPTLFEEPPFIIADLGDIKRNRGGKDDIEESLRLIASGRCLNHALLMVSTAERLSALDSWNDAISASTYIEEPIYTPENFHVALGYLTKASDLGDFTQLAGLSRKAFNHNFEDFVSERPRTLAELGHRFDHIALYCFDYDIRRSKAPRIIGLQKSVSTPKSPLATSLANFVNTRDEATLGRLLDLVDRWRWQKKIGIINLKVRLYTATIAILSDRNLARAATSGERPNGSARNFRDRLCWAVLLLAWEKNLVEDNFIAALDRLCRNFLLCRTAADDGGALRERWGDITLQFATAEDPESSRLAESRTRLKEVLGEHLSVIDLSAQPAWVKDLRLIWDSTKVTAEGAPQTPVMEEQDEGESAAQMLMKELIERHRPKSFEEVLGQDELVSTLARRVATKDHSRHIVLHGAPGSGKFTVALLYAKASQCEDPTPTGSPCQRCASCHAFGQFGGALNYVEIDAKTHGKIEHARYLLRRLIGTLRIAEWSAIVVKNADKLTDYAADMLLKELEKLSVEKRLVPVTFIFILDDVSALRPALRSRTQAFRLRPLADDVALNHLATVCQTENFSYEDLALEAIVRACRAFAGQSLRKLFEIANLGDITLARTLEVCGLDWGDKMLVCWRALLANEPNQGLSLFEELGPDSVSRVRAMQSFLLTIYLHALCSPPIGGKLDPAVGHMSAESWGFVVDGLRDRARTRNMTLAELGSELVSLWADSCVQESVTLRLRYLSFHDLLNEASRGENAC
jgi:hypothetical protein